MLAPLTFLVAGITAIGAALVVTIAGQVSPLLKTQVLPQTYPSPSPSPSPDPATTPSPSSSLSLTPLASPIETLKLLVSPTATTALPGELVTITATTNRPADISLEIVP